MMADRIARLQEALRAGHTRDTAAALAGIGASTLYAWMAAASQPDAAPEFVEFLDAIKKAEIEAEDALLAIVRRAAPKSRQAAAWILERRRPDSWGRKFKADLSVAPPPREAGVTTIEHDMAEAGRAADLIRSVADHARRKVPFADWPAEVQIASGYVDSDAEDLAIPAG
jgi:hypothetical protein